MSEESFVCLIFSLVSFRYVRRYLLQTLQWSPQSFDQVSAPLHNPFMATQLVDPPATTLDALQEVLLKGTPHNAICSTHRSFYFCFYTL